MCGFHRRIPYINDKIYIENIISIAFGLGYILWLYVIHITIYAKSLALWGFIIYN